MTAEYQSQILEDYFKKKEEDQLSLNLRDLTPAKLKRECLLVFDRRFLPKDEKLLESFFNEKGEEDELRQAVKKCEADRFKPLVKFLRGQSKSTDERNIELLGWLIDFEPRPFRRAIEDMYKIGQNLVDVEPTIELPAEPEKPSIISSATGTEFSANDDGAVSGELNNQSIESGATVNIPIQQFKNSDQDEGRRWPKSTNLNQYALLSISVLATFTFAIWVIINRREAQDSGPQQCMLWAGDRYQAVSCNTTSATTPVYALEQKRIHHFQRVTTPDTITDRALGKIWYFKLNGNLEYFTDSGMHPVYTNRRLKPITPYIIQKYLHPNP